MKAQVNASNAWDVVLDARNGSAALTIWNYGAYYPSFLAGITFDSDVSFFVLFMHFKILNTHELSFNFNIIDL